MAAAVVATEVAMDMAVVLLHKSKLSRYLKKHLKSMCIQMVTLLNDFDHLYS